MQASVGRIVHFQDPSANGECVARAALIVKVNNDDTVNLAVWDGTGSQTSYGGVKWSQDPTPYHWNWPPRV